MKLLTLDLATRVGWSVGPLDGPFHSGDYLIEGDDLGTFVNAFRDWLRPILERGIDLCVIEAPIMPKVARFATVRKLTGLAIMTTSLCKDLGIKFEEAHNMSVKKFIGCGNGKENMVAAIRAYGYNPKSHDEADAIALRLYVIAQRSPVVATRMNLDLGLLGTVG